MPVILPVLVIGADTVAVSPTMTTVGVADIG
jgi:hypothetical protein